MSCECRCMVPIPYRGTDIDNPDKKHAQHCRLQCCVSLTPAVERGLSWHQACDEPNDEPVAGSKQQLNAYAHMQAS